MGVELLLEGDDNTLEIRVCLLAYVVGHLPEENTP